MDHLSIGEARRMALACQGFGQQRPTGKVGRRHLQKVVDRLQVIQLDSVNVAVRSHYMPFFSRLGPYPLAELETLAWATHHLFEYWGHQASLLPVEQHPLHRWKMAQHKHDRQSRWFDALEKEHPGYIASVLDEVRERGPLAAGELRDPGKKTGPWWGYSKGKQTLEYLFWTGQVTANRRAGFERVYDVPERAIPPEVLAAPTPTEWEARRALLELSARVLGVGTVSDLTNYFMLNIPKTRPVVAELVEDGVLVPTSVEGWKQPSYRHRDARPPRKVHATALLTPFDNLVWFRDRDERLFDFRYRIEIYTPAPQRVHGYYVLPFLHGERIVARVDVKADRKAKTLVVPSAFAERSVDMGEVAAALAEELMLMARWLGLERVTVGRKGDLSARVRKALSTL